MYARCGAISKARELLDTYKSRNAYSWTAVITECARQGLGVEALMYFDKMQVAGLSPDSVTYACVLKACASTKSIQKGEQIYLKVSKQGLLEKDVVLGTAVVDMYAKCNDLTKAQQVLESLSHRNVTSWNALIGGYCQGGHIEQAFNCLEHMKAEGLSPNAVTFISILKACGGMKSLSMGKRVHHEIARQGLLVNNPKLATALIDMYAKCGSLSRAQQVLGGLNSRNVFSWSTLIDGFVQQGLAQQALDCFNYMQDEGISADSIALICVLKACASLGDLEKGEQIHNEIKKQGLLKENITIGVALLDMYGKCGALVKAQELFKELPFPNTVAWNALLTGYVQHGHSDEVLNSFQQMQSEGLSPDSVTYGCVLKACAISGALDKGKQFHTEISGKNLLKDNITLSTALIDMYAKCGALLEAQRVFDELAPRDVISWSALISGYAQHGHGNEALNCFEQMQLEGLSPDAVTFACILKACGDMKVMHKGEQVHMEIAKQGLLETNPFLGNALVDMYVKCGDLRKAILVLEKLPSRDVVSWGTLMVGFRQHGQSEKVLDCFQQMQDEGILPDALTYCCVLSACSHLGSIEEGYLHFETMTIKYCIKPDIEHYICLIDLFGRSGHLDKAVKVIQEMPSSNSYVLWSALLAACRKWGNVRIGRWAFERAVQIDKSNATAYLLMFNIYASAGMQEDAKAIEELRKENKAGMKSSTSMLVHSITDSDSSVTDVVCKIPHLKTF
ncbi:hypothetical protein KP509_04G031200 [Ceratopteris richardii]|nr:hypothetical protein KP509_04G031200 [Ceratopteris richardii]